MQTIGWMLVHTEPLSIKICYYPYLYEFAELAHDIAAH